MLGNERMKEVCKCGVQHQEWFDVEDGRAKEVIEMWAEWAKRHPYDDAGTLLPDWQRRLHLLDLDNPDCWKIFLTRNERTEHHQNHSKIEENPASAKSRSTKRVQHSLDHDARGATRTTKQTPLEESGNSQRRRRNNWRILHDTEVSGPDSGGRESSESRIELENSQVARETRRNGISSNRGNNRRDTNQRDLVSDLRSLGLASETEDAILAILRTVYRQPTVRKCHLEYLQPCKASGLTMKVVFAGV
jgi:hypothetical protein